MRTSFLSFVIGTGLAATAGLADGLRVDPRVGSAGALGHLLHMAPARGLLGPQQEAGAIPGCILGESFDGRPVIGSLDPADMFPTQSPLSHADGGTIYALGHTPGGVVDNAAALSSPFYNGPVGGPDPLGMRGGMLHVQRASVQDEALPFTESVWFAGYHELYTDGGTTDTALFMSVDIYKSSHADYVRVDWISWQEGMFAAIATSGGWWEDSTRDALAERRGDPNLIEGPMVIVPQIVPVEGIYVLGAKDVPEGSWYTIGVLITSETMTYWLRDVETSDPANNVRTPMRTSGPFAGQRMFAEFGLGLEEGWAQIAPGTEDDPSTPDIIEGYGPALDMKDEPAPDVFMVDGNLVTDLWAAISIDGWRLRVGVDPQEGQGPDYEIGDSWIDNYCVRGVSFSEDFCRADLTFDGVVDAGDLAALIAEWGSGAPWQADVDRDGFIGAADLASLLAAWGECP